MINVIFDVDGTLVDSYGLDTELYCRAVNEVLGQASIRKDWAEYTHVTDAGILAEILQDNDIPPRNQTKRGGAGTVRPACEHGADRSALRLVTRRPIGD